MGTDQAKPTKPGRTPLLNAHTQDRIVSAVRAGSYLDDAATLVGISRHTLLLWLRNGRDAQDRHESGHKLTDRDRLYLDFLNAVETARAEAQLRNIAIIQKAANEGTWQAAAWYLERTNPRKWGRHETVEIGLSDDRPMEVSEIASLLDERIARMRERSLGIIDTDATDADDTEPPSLTIAQ
jgi:hypothetical protein